MIETAMVMAAGHGTRMRPLTDDRAKAMVEVGGKPLIDHMLDRIEAAGVKKAVVNVHAHADHLAAHLSRRGGALEIVISDERDELLETGGGVVKALPLLGDDPILICNIDAIWLPFSPVLEAFAEKWDPSMMDELFLLARADSCLGYHGRGDFDLKPDGTIVWRHGVMAEHIYAGVEIFKPSLAKPFSIEKFSRTEIWEKTLSRCKIFGMELPGYWMHVGDPEARKAAEAVMGQDI